jgi:hypothetical protein
MSNLHTARQPSGERAPAKQFFSLPTAKFGLRSMWLAVTFIAMFAINSIVLMPIFGSATNPALIAISHWFLPFYGIAMLLCGVAAGVTGLISIIKQHERSWVAWLAILPMALVIFLLLGELLFPH